MGNLSTLNLMAGRDKDFQSKRVGMSIREFNQQNPEAMLHLTLFLWFDIGSLRR
jgi:hypothetical protein